MNIVTIIMLVFAILGALDYIIGNRFGLGKEFERGFNLLGTLALAMIGIITLSPLIAELLKPFFDLVYNTLHIDPSIITASIFANDMGGAQLARDVAKDPALGAFNGLIVASMMGCLVSFIIPFSISTVKREFHKELLLGLLCGAVTVPVGCFVGGLLCKISIDQLLFNLLPLIIFAVIIALGLWFCPNVCVKIFSAFGKFMKIVIVAGLMLAVVDFLLGFEIIKGLAPVEEGVMICFNISVILAGAFPLMLIASRILKRPLEWLANKLGIGSTATAGFLSTAVTAPLVFEMMNDMDRKGIAMNAAFVVSASCLFGDHLAFTLAFDEAYIFPVIISKFISGASAVMLATVIYKRTAK